VEEETGEGTAEEGEVTVVEVMITMALRCEAVEVMPPLDGVVTDLEVDVEDLVHKDEAPLAQVE